LNLRRFSRGLFVGLFVLAIGILLGLMLLSVIWHRVPSFVGYVVASLPLFFALLLSMWAALPHAERSGAAKIPA